MIRAGSVLLRLVVPRVSLRVNTDSRCFCGRKCHRGLVAALDSPVFPWPWWSHSQLGRGLTQTGEHFSSRDSLNPRSSLGRIVLKSLLHKTSKRCYEGYLCLWGCCLNHIGSGPFKSRNNWPHTHEILHSFHRACGPLTLQCIPKLRFASDTLRSSVAAKHSRPF